MQLSSNKRNASRQISVQISDYEKNKYCKDFIHRPIGVRVCKVGARMAEVVDRSGDHFTSRRLI